MSIDLFINPRGAEPNRNRTPQNQPEPPEEPQEEEEQEEEEVDEDWPPRG